MNIKMNIKKETKAENIKYTKYKKKYELKGDKKPFTQTVAWGAFKKREYDILFA